jgi:hypothetical protein
MWQVALKVNAYKLIYLPHRNKIFIKVWALQIYLVQELDHCDVHIQLCLLSRLTSVLM